MKKVYDVVQTPFGDKVNFKQRVIATCKTAQLARCVIARCNTAMHTFEIVERTVKPA